LELRDRLILNRNQVQQVDRLAIDKYGIPGLVLMENAGRGVVDVLCELGIDGPVLICCGKGNNAGDGFVMARHLELRRIDVRVVLFFSPDELTGDAATNYRILTKTDVSILELGGTYRPERLDAVLDGSTWIVDALLGTGAVGAPRAPLDAVIRRLNEQPAKRLAVDVPSGLDCDTGFVASVAFRAHHTCTFVACKPGLLVASAALYVGQLHVLDIGAPRQVVDEVLRSAR
jgi:NAD(P)H-hydrate epimerase